MDNKEFMELQKLLRAQQADVNKAEVIVQGLLQQIREQAEEVRKWNSRYKAILKHLICAAKERGANGVLTLTKHGVNSVPDDAGVDIEEHNKKYVIKPYYGEKHDRKEPDTSADDAGDVPTVPTVEDKDEGSGV